MQHDAAFAGLDRNVACMHLLGACKQVHAGQVMLRVMPTHSFVCLDEDSARIHNMRPAPFIIGAAVAQEQCSLVA